MATHPYGGAFIILLKGTEPSKPLLGKDFARDLQRQGGISRDPKSGGYYRDLLGLGGVFSGPPLIRVPRKYFLGGPSKAFLGEDFTLRKAFEIPPGGKKNKKRGPPLPY